VLNTYISLSAIQHDLKQGKLTVSTLVKNYLSQIEHNKHLNAFLEVFTDEALQRATLIDERIKSGKAGKLHGLVIGLKDVICYKGHKVTAGSKILRGFESLYSATVTERLLAEDAIIIGRNNCDEFAMGTSNENSAYGPVKNGLDETKVPGGSSGGSAVAVQMDMCLAALGTDTGGSVRQPASFCGLIGFKPTYGRVSRHGSIAYASSFDQISILSKSIEDSALILEVIAGLDVYDSTLSSLPVDNYSSKLNTNQKFSIAYFPEVNGHPRLDKEISSSINELIGSLKTKGHETQAASFEYLDYLVPAYYVLTTAEASSNLARYDGVRYGYHSPNATDIQSTYTKNRTEGFGAEVKRRIMLGTFVLSSGYYDAYYTQAQRVRNFIIQKINEVLKETDFIILPTAPTTAFAIGEKSGDPIEMYLADIFTVLAPLVGAPAISLPLGKHSNGMPFGVQIIGKKFNETNLLNFSYYLMRNQAQ
jgi:aspartyl-tRNA(Asn)/glutamyl-tRNA(Gln) amidotransferase subunit A